MPGDFLNAEGKPLRVYDELMNIVVEKGKTENDGLKETLVLSNESDEKGNNWFSLKNEIVPFEMIGSDQIRQDSRIEGIMDFPIATYIQPTSKEFTELKNKTNTNRLK